MPRVNVLRQSKIVRSPRVMQVEGMFDVAPSERSELTWDVDLPIEDVEWNVGLIVGPSGSGKSTVAREIFGEGFVHGFSWPDEHSVLDAFPREMPIKEITTLLSNVGFSSPPSWLRPFGALSNGEQFRVTIARALAEYRDLCVIDEFTSVVDRTVAKIGSAAVAKTVRQRGQKFVAVSCHYDIADWLEPDWIYEPHTGRFARDCLRRPDIELTVRRVHHSAWRLFAHHHYMSRDLNPSARCFVAFVDGVPAAFDAVLAFPHAHRPGWRFTRAVVLPDFQGVGIGWRLTNAIAAAFRATKKPVFLTAAHPALVYALARSKKWKMRRKGTLNAKPGRTSSLNRRIGDSCAWDRLTYSFEYVGEADAEAAEGFGITTRNDIRRRSPALP